MFLASNQVDLCTKLVEACAFNVRIRLNNFSNKYACDFSVFCLFIRLCSIF